MYDSEGHGTCLGRRAEAVLNPCSARCELGSIWLGICSIVYVTSAAMLVPKSASVAVLFGPDDARMYTVFINQAAASYHAAHEQPGVVITS